MIKQLNQIFLILCLLIPMTGCAQNAASTSSAAADTKNTISFQDDLGHTFQIAKPLRVAVTMGSFADIWCLAGGKEELVAACSDAFTDFDLELSDSVADLGAIKEPSTETLIASRPDLVLASSNLSPDLKMEQPLTAAGIPVAYFDASTFDSYLNLLKICTDLTGESDRYVTYGTSVKQQIDDAKSCVNGSNPSVLFVRVTGSTCTVKNSQGTVLGEMLEDLGCHNIADSDTSLLENLSMEAIVASDPAFIFTVIAGTDTDAGEKALQNTLLNQPAWQNLTAVKEGHFYVLDRHLYHLKPNERWGEAYAQLAQILYPKKES